VDTASGLSASKSWLQHAVVVRDDLSQTFSLCAEAMEDAISYIRVSSEEQADSGLGLEA
jgi:hypothetical protein